MNRGEFDSEGGLRRRDVVKLVGATAVGGAALSATASAHAAGCVYFCGCGRMVAYRNEPRENDNCAEGSGEGEGFPDTYPIFVAKEGGGPGPATIDHYLVDGECRNVETTQRGRGKILAFGFAFDDGTSEDVNRVYLNPNQCAQNVFDEYGGHAETIEEYVQREDDEDWGEVEFYGYDGAKYEYFDGRKGHCHPPRDDWHCEHDRGSRSKGNGNGNSNKGRGRGRGR